MSEALQSSVAMANEIGNADTVKNREKLIMGATAHYWSDLNKYNPVETAKGLKMPVLILQGARDYNVTMKDFNIWKTSLANKKNVSFKLYPKLNHGFVEAPGAMGTPKDYAIPASVPLYVVNDIAIFILKK